MHISDGRLIFKVTSSDGTQSEWECDTVEMKLIFEEMEALHNVVTKDNKLAPTITFFEDVKQLLIKRGLEGCTTSAASHVWNSVTSQFIHQHQQIEAQVAELVS